MNQEQIKFHLAKGFLTEIEDEDYDLGTIYEVVSPFWLLHVSSFDGTVTDLRGILPSGEGVDYEGNKYTLTAKNWVRLREIPDLAGNPYGLPDEVKVALAAIESFIDPLEDEYIREALNTIKVLRGEG